MMSLPLLIGLSVSQFSVPVLLRTLGASIRKMTESTITVVLTDTLGFALAADVMV